MRGGDVSDDRVVEGAGVLAVAVEGDAADPAARTPEGGQSPPGRGKPCDVPGMELPDGVREYLLVAGASEVLQPVGENLVSVLPSIV